ncbi:LysM peptidoglycan-binding domain-containing protein [Cellulomonas xiejunii]|uniref:LysM peptidoglycan-binding domain-containing protein n=1 Tax=Cellulomonas xiejunii TaxID=2968083 RepID=A0ABY5KIV1_9CELL|nr:LysM peptidoglycan-binding domain-containing protein [Cellulomonas xiejunii]MCC2313225.1 LysM peptidoglycan-binding domain-containing protein [Cellulomonas xiejunii]MCC2319922.1 LysM peptidoglycan-binding domain-containing protein [Cellulomonas xiejunii]UUI70244.1 LysM peptidoglycan-binding domain-containing protein [Cellulomonas xiejunii]
MSATTPRPRTTTRVATGAGATLALATVALAATGTAGHAADYTVREGDTLTSIAKRSGTTASRIARDNAMSDPSRIRAGQVLRLPDTAPPATAAPRPAPAGASYVVRTGDTVSAIASRHGTTVAAVVAANGLDARAFIRAGQTLTIPGTGSPQPAAAPAAAPASAGSTYTVRTGDTVSAIASRHGTTVAAVVAANGLDARAFIRAGQKLTVPGSTAAAPATQLVGNTFAGRTYSADVVGAANQNKATLLAAGAPSRADMQAKVATTARAMGVDAALAQAVAHQESGFDHTAVSPANAIGTMQVIPSSGEWASQLVGRQLDLLSPDDNVVAGVAILRSLVRTSPDLPTAIASYYQGASSVKRNGMYADTRRYVANVQTLMTRFG